MKKIGLICLALVFALGALGVGYAMWSEELLITGTVETGSVDVTCEEYYTDDDGTMDDEAVDPLDVADAGDPLASGPNAPRGDKNVGSSSATCTGLTGTIAILNAYPCYYTTAYFVIVNSGTIPVIIAKVEEHCDVVHWTSIDDGTTWVERAACQWYEVEPCVVKLIDFGEWDEGAAEQVSDGEADLAVHITGEDLIGTQLEPLDTALINVDIHVEQGAAELAEGEGAYTFDERVTVVQWNEYD